jgi:hypothetical protein
MHSYIGAQDERNLSFIFLQGNLKKKEWDVCLDL